MNAGSMTGYVLVRLAQLLPIVFVIVVVNFFLIRLAPGDPIAYIIGDAAISPEYVADLRRKLGLDNSLLRQLLIYLGNVARGDFGYSFVSRQPVIEVILARLPATLLLMITQYILAIAAGLMLGVISARRQGSTVDTTVTLISVIGYAMPVFWLGQMLMLIFANKLGWFPAQGMFSLRYDLGPFGTVLDVAHHLVLPATTLAFFNLALIARLTRANMLQVLRLEYVIFASHRPARQILTDYHARGLRSRSSPRRPARL